MFQLNEAPNMVLLKLNSHEQKRNCGKFWSILFCLPTFGASIGLCSQTEGKNWWGCYPANVSLESDVTEKVLKEKLAQLIITKEQINKDPNLDKRKLIEWQVKQTLAILKKAIDDKVIQGSYQFTLIKLYKKINTQAKQEEQFGLLIDSEHSPLNGTQPYTPNYTLNKK